jgi:surface protein
MPFAAHSLISAQHFQLRRFGRQQLSRQGVITIGALVNYQPSTVVLNIAGLTLGTLTTAEKEAFINEFAALLGVSSDLITLTFTAGSLILNMGIDGNKVDTTQDKAFVINTQAAVNQLNDSDITTVIEKSSTQAAITGQPSIARTSTAVSMDPLLLQTTVASTDTYDVINPVVGDSTNTCMYTLINERIVRIDKFGSVGKICNFPESSLSYMFITSDSNFLVIPTNVFSMENINSSGQSNLPYSSPHANKVYVVHISSGTIFINTTVSDFGLGGGFGFNPFNNTIYYCSPYVSTYLQSYTSTISFSDSNILSIPGPSVLDINSNIVFSDIDTGFVCIDAKVERIKISTNTKTRIAGSGVSYSLGGWSNTPQGDRNTWNNSNGNVYGPFEDAPVGTNAWFTYILPNGSAIDRINNRLLVVDTYAQRLRSVDLSGINTEVLTLAGTSPISYGNAINVNGGTLSSSVLSSLGQVGTWDNGINSMPPYEKVNSTYLTSTFNAPSNVTMFGNTILIREANGTRLLANGYVSDFIVMGDIDEPYSPIPNTTRFTFTISADHPDTVIFPYLNLAEVSSIKWGDGLRNDRPSSDTHIYTTPGPHTIEIRGRFTKVPVHISFTPYITNVSHYAGLTDMSAMFLDTISFNQDISNWDTSKVTNMENMFNSAKAFNQPIGAWDTSNVTNMAGMFTRANAFNQPIGTWNTSKVTNMKNMFGNIAQFIDLIQRPFNQPIGAWDTSNVTDMSGMFARTQFNQDISNWNTSKVTNMAKMFESAIMFNQPINTNITTGAWDTSNVTNMASMFDSASVFNQPIGNWDTSNVTSMESMFDNTPYVGTTFDRQSAFNQNISEWDTSNVTNMRRMFSGARSFNQPINTNITTGAWDTSNVTNMSEMFFAAQAFNQPLGDWDTSSVRDMSGMFANVIEGEPSAFDQPIGDWTTSNVRNMSRMFHGATVFNKPIGDWDTTNVGNMDLMFDNALLFNQPIGDWNTSNVGTMRQMFVGTVFNQPIGDWNTSAVVEMSSMFAGARAFNQPIGNWNTGLVYNMRFMFSGATAFNQPIGDWNTSAVQNMESMFMRARAFNQPIGNWNTGSVNTMRYMFSGAIAFNRPMTSWNTTNLIDMSGMFNEAISFNQPIGNWNTRNVRDMRQMFANASAFNQNISSWILVNVNNLVQMFRGVPGYNITPSNYTNITNKAFTLGQSLT